MDPKNEYLKTIVNHLVLMVRIPMQNFKFITSLEHRLFRWDDNDEDDDTLG